MKNLSLKRYGFLSVCQPLMYYVLGLGHSAISLLAGAWVGYWTCVRAHCGPWSLRDGAVLAAA